MVLLKKLKSKLLLQYFKDKNLSELIKGSASALLLKILGMFFGYVAMLFVTNNYGAKEWGIYSLCFTILSIAVLFPKFGFDNALVRIIAELNLSNKRNEIIKVILKTLIISISISLAIIILLNIFSDFIIYNVLNQENIKPYIKIISFAIIPTVVLVIIAAIFQALKKTSLFILFQTTLVNIIFLLLLVIYYTQKLEVKVFELYFFAITIVLFIALYYLITSLRTKSKEEKNTQDTQKPYTYKSIINISWPMLLSNSFAILMAWSDIIMLSYYKTPSDVGIYDSALKLAMLSSISLIGINAIVTPKFVEFYSNNDIEGLKKTVQNSTKLIFFTATPILLALIFFSKTVLGFFGKEFIVGYLALIYLCISRFVNAISGSVGYIMQMTDQQKTFKNILIIAFLINVILNLILIPKYSYTGAAIASSISMIFWNITLVFYIKKRLGFWTIYLPFVKLNKI